jgi:hypothetical protein
MGGSKGLGFRAAITPGTITCQNNQCGQFQGNTVLFSTNKDTGSCFKQPDFFLSSQCTAKLLQAIEED